MLLLWFGVIEDPPSSLALVQVLGPALLCSGKIKVWDSPTLILILLWLWSWPDQALLLPGLVLTPSCCYRLALHSSHPKMEISPHYLRAIICFLLGVFLLPRRICWLEGHAAVVCCLPGLFFPAFLICIWPQIPPSCYQPGFILSFLRMALNNNIRLKKQFNILPTGTILICQDLTLINRLQIMSLSQVSANKLPIDIYSPSHFPSDIKYKMKWHCSLPK